MPPSPLITEWTLLQNQYDSYEKYSLLIKLGNVLVLCVSLWLGYSSLYLLLPLLILWGQDAIWKTFQARIEFRLLQVETYLSEPAQADSPDRACQYHRDFQARRRGGIRMILEYAVQALRPTVAYPHVLLVSAAVLLHYY